MEQDLDALKARLLDELKNSVYPSERSTIRDRYTDTSYLIFKTFQAKHRGSFLSFGSRRSSLISSYGNTPTFIRRSFSSNGMLEYSVEQTGTTKNKERPSHVLPFITKEEKEMEDAEEQNMLALVQVKHEHNNDKKVTKFNNKDMITVQDKDKISSKDLGSLEFIDTSCNENDDSEFSSKNRKIFLHYDMPLSRKPPVQNDVPTEISEDFVLQPIERKQIYGLDQKIEKDNEHITKNHKELKSLNEKEIYFPIIPIKTVSQSSNETEASIYNTSVEPFPRKNSLLIVEEDEFPSILPNSSCLGRSSSIKEKNGTPFTRESVNRVSLRELPLRSPTPPKRSQRKPSKKEKYILKSPIDSVSSLNTSLDSKGSIRLPLQASSPQLEPSDLENRGNIVLPSLSSAEPVTKSAHNLDDTPLYIVEEGDQLVKVPRFSASRTEIEDLVSDKKVNNSFIIVHSPASDSNSLGLAPLSLKNRKLSSSSSISGHSSKNNFFSHSVERSTSTTTKSTKFSSVDSTSSTSSSYYSTKQSTQIQLLKFTKSEDESSFVIPPPNGAKNCSYLVTNSRIRSLPLDNSSESYLSRYSSKDFVYTNSSRVCSLM